LTVAAFVAAIGLCALLALGPDGKGTSKPVDRPAAVEVDIATSSTKEAWLEAAASAFAATGASVDGRPILIRPRPVLSGGSLQAILDGQLRPAAWSPGSLSWVEAFDAEWRRAHGTPAMTAPCRPTVATPLGIAMWRPMAEALGWPDRPIGWSTIVALAGNPDGWRAYGHPEWGRFRLGYPHPVYSNVGMLFMTAITYGIAGKANGLTAVDVYAPTVRAAMAALGQSTTRYGMQSTDLLSAMVEQGPGALHAVAAFENDSVALNLSKAGRLPYPIAFVIPTEGTFWSDQPFCILDGTDWVGAEATEAARRFLDFLLAPDQQALATRFRLRPLDPALPLGDQLTLANGTDPRVGPRSVASLPEPSGDLMRAVADVFAITKRKATLLLVIDTSASMAGEKMRSATEATLRFLGRLDPEDVVGIVTFSDDIRRLVPLERAERTVEAHTDEIRALVARGGTALYSAVCNALRTLSNRRQADRVAGLNRLYGVVLVSDGQNSTAEMSENEMHATCLQQSADSDPIRVNPIAFGADADVAVLSRIAAATGGTLYAADPKSIDKAYLNMSSEQ
jgi:Ca-activated chloride channel family protein